MNKDIEAVFELAGRIRRSDLLHDMFKMPESPFIICEFNMVNYTFLSMSESSLTAWGYTPSEMVGKTYRDFCTAEDLAASDAQVSENLNTGKYVYNFRNRYIHKDGHYVYNNWSVTKPNVDKICLCICLFQDKPFKAD